MTQVLQHQHQICTIDEIAPDSVTGKDLPDGRRVAVYHFDGNFYATDDNCSHGNASLSEDGTLDGCVIECGLHFGSFDIRTGAVVAAPCTRPLRTYPVQIRDGSVWLELGQEP